MMRVATLLCLLALFAASANATMIVIEPDDYAPGTAITHEYATVTSYSNYQANPQIASTATYGGYGAPTGSAHFGNPVTIFGPQGNDIPMFGLVFEFAMPIDSVSILALNYGYGPGLHVDCSLWLIGAASRSRCEGTPDRTALGETTLYTFSFGGQAFDRITFGGGSAIGAFIFDRLEAHVVPEPETLAMMLAGLVGIAVTTRRRRKAAAIQG